MAGAWAASRVIPLQIRCTLLAEQYGLDPGRCGGAAKRCRDGVAVSPVTIMVS